ncbi:FYVE zinc finger domain-containing protein [Aspergillus fischeri NRRL 181]|uniref:FYVE domain protein, putative n=1 Tax=Neosartorya fischeri (strain ATCC 1020 / DSM 3700 / CBS 544.65 / FGSC A1164 / JCM 1740 / NRRL 181 / WB 181) TaxID=331117 RepID=A1D160_NEOFI|nr:FYVE domain protein, putative [Aspergillus fischeri NRRL 181]EAW22153.1 FYVE domain protein, putative [Aspergillus fischeri NRRL 181]
MATHVVTTTTISPLSANQISVYGHPSPVNSASATPAKNSPTSPRLQHLPLQCRQLRPLKGPLYVPAALRPTERPQKSSPPTPPRSVHGSLDSLNDEEPSTLVSRRSTMESNFNNTISKLAENEWMKTEHLGQVTGLPTREHWKAMSKKINNAPSQADAASPNCDSPTCRSSFGLFLRRHHCRHCGHVFCSSHTPHIVPLDQDARFHPEGVPSRACDLCWSAYQRWEEARTERLNKIQTLLTQQETTGNINQDTESATNVTASSDTPQQDDPSNQATNAPQGQATEIAASVPRGWNWSTF